MGMSLYHFIVDGVVINTVEQDSPVNPWNYFAVMDDNARIGWLWDGQKLNPPPPKPIEPKAPDRIDGLASLLVNKGLITQAEADGIKGGSRGVDKL
jgi:hypothetical protein